MTTTTVSEAAPPAVVARLSRLDRFLPLWIGVAMLAGLLLGRLVPGLDRALDAVAIDGVSLPIAIGLLVMMYPVLAKVRYDRLAAVTADRRLLAWSLVLNWLVGPAVMFTLAWVFLADHAEYRTGLIIVGLARCIAMVIIWNDLACGDREMAAVLVALNSLFQVAAFGVLGWFYLSVLPGWLGLSGAHLDVSGWDIARNVLIFLGIPLAAGYATRRLGERARGREWYETRFLPRIGPAALYGLLFTIVILFALQGEAITSQPWDVVMIAAPLLVYFTIMWAGSFALGTAIGLSYERTTTLAFTAAGNNFELAIAVAIATFGITSGQALAGAVGPLIEVPVLIALVYLSLALRRRLFDRPPATPQQPRQPPDHDEPAPAPNPPTDPMPTTGEDKGMHDKPSVLFVCVHNAGRSQMAAGWLRHLAGDRVEVRSAGSAPAETLNPAAVEAMREVGIDITDQSPALLEWDMARASDVIITMGCGDACPVFPGKRYEDWELDDPAGKNIDAVRPIRDEIRTRVEQLLADLTQTSRRSHGPER